MEHHTYRPTQKMATNAKKGLELRGRFHRGGTEVGVHRAEQIVRQAELTAEYHSALITTGEPMRAFRWT